MKKWYLFDKSTGAYEFNYLEAAEQPDNSTDVDPGDLTNPIWDGSQWVAGQSEVPEEQPTQQEQLNASVLAQIAQNKADQDKFNAQILLQLAKGGN